MQVNVSTLASVLPVLVLALLATAARNCEWNDVELFNPDTINRQQYKFKNLSLRN